MKSASSTACWQHFDHDADIGVRGSGATQAEAFEQAALALTAIVTKIDWVEPRQQIELKAENTKLKSQVANLEEALAIHSYEDGEDDVSVE